MNLDSKSDRESLREKFFDAVGDAFVRGASVEKLRDLSVERGVWDEVKDQLATLGITEWIKRFIRNAKDDSGRRIYHSLNALDSEGNEIPVYKPVALFELDDYKIVIPKYEKRIGEEAAIYLDLISQAKERYGYEYPVPPEIRAYLDIQARRTVETAEQPSVSERGKRGIRRELNESPVPSST